WLSNSARVHLSLRVAVHTGSAYAAVFGHSGIQFDLVGSDIALLTRLRRLANRSGRVLVSATSFDQLPEGYRGEAGPVLELDSHDGQAASTLSAYFVQQRNPVSCLESDRPSVCTATLDDVQTQQICCLEGDKDEVKVMMP
ncbi:unnamed protein product, partial [Protopolystoma xenopodis]